MSRIFLYHILPSLQNSPQRNLFVTKIQNLSPQTFLLSPLTILSPPLLHSLTSLFQNPSLSLPHLNLNLIIHRGKKKRGKRVLFPLPFFLDPLLLPSHPYSPFLRGCKGATVATFLGGSVKGECGRCGFKKGK